MKPYTLLPILLLSSCIAYTDRAGIAWGTDMEEYNHKFGDSVTFKKVNQSKTAIQVTKTAGGSINLWTLTKGLVKMDDNATDIDNANIKSQTQANTEANNLKIVKENNRHIEAMPEPEVIPTTPTP